MRTVFSVMLSMVKSFIGGGFTEVGSMLEDGVKLQSSKRYEYIKNIMCIEEMKRVREVRENRKMEGCGAEGGVAGLLLYYFLACLACFTIITRTIETTK